VGRTGNVTLPGDLTIGASLSVSMESSLEAVGWKVSGKVLGSGWTIVGNRVLRDGVL